MLTTTTPSLAAKPLPSLVIPSPLEKEPAGVIIGKIVRQWLISRRDVAQDKRSLALYNISDRTLAVG